jgi:tetratricopeptide (TPR) repeat protein
MNSFLLQARSYGAIITVIALSFLYCTQLSFAFDAKKEAKHMERARAYIEKNELRKAVIEYMNVVQINPKNDMAYLELGDAHLRLNQGGEAFEAFSRAAAANPNNMEAQLRLGQFLLLNKQTQAAKEKAVLVLENNPNNVSGLSLLSGVYLQEGKADKAVEAMEKAVSLEPTNFGGQLSLARLYLERQDLEKAEKAYQRAAALDPGSRIPNVELSTIYRELGQWDKAEAELIKLVDKSYGTKHQDLIVLAGFYETRKDWQKAEKTYLEAIEAAPKEDVAPIMYLGGYYARRGSYEKSLKMFNKALNLRKDDPTIQVSIAQIHFDYKNMREAEAVVNRLLKNDPNQVGANFLKGRILLVGRDYQGAIERFDRVIQLEPSGGMAHYFKALCFRALGDMKRAELDLLKAVELTPGLIEGRLLLAEIYLQANMTKLARPQIDEALKTSPQNIRALILDGNARVLDKDLIGAEAAFSKVLALAPNYAPAHVRLGLVYIEMGRNMEALKSLEKALELNPTQTETLALMVGIFAEEKRYTDAHRLCQGHRAKVARYPSTLAYVAFLEGNIALEEGDSKRAEQFYQEAIESYPSSLHPYEALAQLYINEGRSIEAIERYEAVLRKNSNHLPATMGLGTLHYKRGDTKKAEPHFRKALKIQPDFAPAANYLAMILAGEEGNIDEALDFAKMARQKMPRSASVIDTLGWVYYLKGRYPKAISELQTAATLEPTNPVIHYHLAMAFYKNKQTKEARDLLNKALEMNDDFQGSEEAKKILRELGNTAS